MKPRIVLALFMLAAPGVCGAPGDISAEHLAKIKAKFEADGIVPPSVDEEGNPVDIEAVKAKLKDLGKDNPEKTLAPKLWSKAQGPWNKMGRKAYGQHKQREGKEARTEAKAQGLGPEPAPMKGFPSDGTQEEQQAWAEKKKAAAEKWKAAAEKGKGFFNKFKSTTKGMGDRIRKQANKFADARGEGIGSNTEAR